MSTKNAQADNITMSSGGLYSLATLGAKDVIDKENADDCDKVRNFHIIQRLGRAVLVGWIRIGPRVSL